MCIVYILVSVFLFLTTAISEPILAEPLEPNNGAQQELRLLNLEQQSPLLLASGSGNNYTGGIRNLVSEEESNENNNEKARKVSRKNKQQHANRKMSNITRRLSVQRIYHPSLHAVWDEFNQTCLLAKFQASFTISYETNSGTTERILDKMPLDSQFSGRCDKFDEGKTTLDVIWKRTGLSKNIDGFTFRMTFQKFPEEGRWGVLQMQFLYHTGHPAFRGAAKNPRKFIVKSREDDYQLQFHTNLGNSMLCPSPPPVRMYDSEGTEKVIARLSNLQLQAFEFGEAHESPNFDAFMRCEQVSFGSGVAHPLTNVRNDSLTFAIGVMTVCIATLTVIGYAFYRSKVVNSEKYKNII